MRPVGLRVRFWVQAALGAAAAALGVATIAWEDWTEVVFHLNPDIGNGSVEWMFLLVLATMTVSFAGGARLEWRRARWAARRSPRLSRTSASVCPDHP